MRSSLLTCLLLLAAPAAADSVLITEVVTDPQADHSENTGGNGMPYDLAPGTGTISSVDEFVELFNAGATPVDLTGYTLDFQDTTPSAYTFGVTSTGALRFSDGSSLEALLPGGFLLLGNPPGALNNRLEIELRDPGGALLDLLSVPDGNATSALDEAVARLWSGSAFTGELVRAGISPLRPGAPVPEPGFLGWLGLSVLGAGSLATAGRARRAASRRPSATPRAPTDPPAARRTRGGSRGIPAARGGSA